MMGDLGAAHGWSEKEEERRKSESQRRADRELGRLMRSELSRRVSFPEREQ